MTQQLPALSGVRAIGRQWCPTANAVHPQGLRYVSKLLATNRLYRPTLPRISQMRLTGEY